MILILFLYIQLYNVFHSVFMTCCREVVLTSSDRSVCLSAASLQLLFLVQLEIHEEKMKNKDLICRFKTLRLFWSSSLITFLKMNCVNAAAGQSLFSGNLFSSHLLLELRRLTSELRLH